MTGNPPGHVFRALRFDQLAEPAGGVGRESKMFWKTYEIRRRERGFFYRRGEYVATLTPGKHRFWGWPWNLRVEIHDTHAIELDTEELSSP